MQTKINSVSAIGGLLACVAALLFCGVQTDAQPAPAITPEAAGTPSSRGQPLLPRPLHPSLVPGRHYGVGSCAASNCHGGAGTKETVGSEYSIWIQEDLDSQAFTALYNNLSQNIAKKLGIGKAYEAKICRSCHAANVIPTSPALAGSSVLRKYLVADSGRWMGVVCQGSRRVGDFGCAKGRVAM